MTDIISTNPVHIHRMEFTETMGELPEYFVSKVTKRLGTSANKALKKEGFSNNDICPSISHGILLPERSEDFDFLKAI